MHIEKVVIKNYRCLADSAIKLNKHLNIIVGNNECGKSTLLEAVNLALSGYLNGRQIQGELHPYLFNTDAVTSYIKALIDKTPASPPAILIELYFAEHLELTALKGTNNAAKEDVPGVQMSIEFNDEYKDEYANYIADPTIIKTIPIEYYIVRWRNFAGNDITARSIPLKPSFIDASTIRNNAAANRYVLDIVKDSLTEKQQVDLALSYRMMKDKFLEDAKVAAINKSFHDKKGQVSDKALTVSLDTSARASWETGIMPHLNDIPMPLVGKGEQNSIKIKLAMESSSESHLFLIEETENHLSYTNLNKLIDEISKKRGDRQLLITTHSSFVLNKLGVEAVHLFHRGKSITLNALTPSTHDYFLKLPGYDTLRLILASRAILVEGPSDELIVQKAFYLKHGAMPTERGVDVISVSSLAFKRFLEIGAILKSKIDVVTDNDGDVAALNGKYAGYLNNDNDNIHINYNDDIAAPTLEPQLLKFNSRATLNKILGKDFQNDVDLLHYMKNNKTECALKFFETDTAWVVPDYIANAIG